MDRNEKGQFVKGSTPFNKGKPMKEWMSKDMIKRTKKTRFRKGNLPQTAKPLGHVSRVVHKRHGQIVGYDWFININWKGERYNHYNYRKYLWETFYGEAAPKGAIFICRDGDQAKKPTIDNIDMITRAELMMMNNPKLL